MCIEAAKRLEAGDRITDGDSAPIIVVGHDADGIMVWDARFPVREFHISYESCAAYSLKSPR